MPAITVSPGYQGSLLFFAFHSGDGTMPALSPTRSMPVGWPNPYLRIHLSKRWMPIS